MLASLCPSCLQHLPASPSPSGSVFLQRPNHTSSPMWGSRWPSGGGDTVPQSALGPALSHLICLEWPIRLQGLSSSLLHLPRGQRRAWGRAVFLSNIFFKQRHPQCEHLFKCLSNTVFPTPVTSVCRAHVFSVKCCVLWKSLPTGWRFDQSLVTPPLG